MLVELACRYQGPRHFFNASVHLRKFRIADDFAIHGNPLINPYQMGRGVETGFVSGLLQDPGQEDAGRTFAFGARHMHDLQIAGRIAGQVQELLDAPRRRQPRQEPRFPPREAEIGRDFPRRAHAGIMRSGPRSSE